VAIIIITIIQHSVVAVVAMSHRIITIADPAMIQDQVTTQDQLQSIIIIIMTVN
jgi:hypothetical protein